MKQKLYLLLFVLLVSVTSKAQSFTENFNTDSGQAVNSFTKTLSGVPFTFTYATNVDDENTIWSNASGIGSSPSVKLTSLNNNASTEIFVIKRQDNKDFVFNSLYCNNPNFTAQAVLGGYNNNVLVGSTKTIPSGSSGVLNFGGIVVDEVRISSTNLALFIDDFSGINFPAATHLNFDGANDNVTIPSQVAGAIASGSEITIEYWFKGTNLQSAVRFQNGNNYIVAGWSGSNPQFIVSTDGGTNGVSNGTDAVIEDNNWHHIACVWKKNVRFATYLDGVLQNARAAANVNLPNLAGTEGKLGSLNGGSEFMTGNLDDVRIWNVARTGAQISANRNCELQGNESGLIAYYKFNQGLDATDNTEIATLTDATAAANNGTLLNFARTGATSNFLSGSPVTTGITIPTAPNVLTQIFCGATTANSLRPAISATIKWYASATALVTTDILTTGTYYVATVNANGCESERTAVSVVIVKNPEPETTQNFCNSATVNDLKPAPSTTITWYTDQAATTALASTTALVDGTTYYVQAASIGCPASTPVSSTVSITSATAPTNIGGEVTDEVNKNLNVIYTGADCSSLNGLYVVNGTLNGKNVYSQLGGMRTIGYDNIDNKWKLYYGNNISLSLTASNNSTANYPPATGWILEECAGTLTTETASTYNQIVCNNSNATHLMPPPSDTIKWFESATGTYNFDSNYPLSDDVYYVAGVNENGCESPRTAVSVSFLPQAAAPIVVGTPIATSGITTSVTGGCSNFNGNYYWGYTDSNGKNVYFNETNKTRIIYDDYGKLWKLGTYNAQFDTYFLDFYYFTTSSSAFPPTTGWVVANNTPCTGVNLSIAFTQIEQKYCQGATAASIAGTDPSLKIYNNNGQNIALTDVLTTGIYAVVSVGANGCESAGAMVQINVETVAPPVPPSPSISFTSSLVNLIILCSGTDTVVLFNGTFNYNGQDANGRNKYVFADDAQVELKYLGFPFNWVIIKQTNVLFKSDDISTENVPPTLGWTSTCGNVAVTVTVNDFAQSFCGNATVANLTATGTGTIKWYNVDNGGTALNSNDAIATGNYYVSQTNANGCESSRVKVAVNVTSAPTATAQSFCGAATVNDLVATGSGILKWYNDATAGSALTASATLSTGDYYVSTLNANNCESSRTVVSVTVNSIPLAPTANTQIFEKYTTTANLVATGTNLKWYNDAANGSALANSAPIYTGTYYVSQTLNNCESASRTAVSITVNTATWDGSAWINNIVPDISKGAVFIGNYAQAFDLVAKGVEVIGTSIVTIPSGFDFTVDSWIEVASSASLVFENNSNLIQINAATNTGNIVYKRNAQMNRLDYVFWSSPVANQNLFGFTPNTFANRFYTFSEPTKSYMQVASPSTTNFEVAKGYSLRAPNNFLDAPTATQTFVGVYTGVPNNGNITIPVTFTASPTGGNGYNMIGNPYPSTVSGPAFLTANTGSIYFWTHQSYYVGTVLTNGGVANYASMNLSGSVAATVNNGVNITPNGFIQAGQGFMFLTTSNKNVTFTNAMRTGNNDGQFFRSAQTTENNKLWLNLTNNNGAFSQTMVAYLPNTTNGFDDGFDAKQLNSNGNVLSSTIANENYAIQSRGNFNNTDVVKLNLNIATAGNYTLSKDNTNGIFSNTQDFFLKDNLLGTTHNIKQNPYNFVANAGTIANRFEIVYQAALSNNSNLFANANVIVFEQNGLLNISATDDLKNVKAFDVQGRNIFELKDINAKATILNGFRPQQQVLLLQITNLDNQVVTKKVVF